MIDVTNNFSLVKNIVFMVCRLGVVLVIYCYIANYPKIWWLKKNKYLLSNSFCVSGIWEWVSWMVLTWVSHEIAVKMLTRGCSHQKALLGLDDLPPRRFTHTAVSKKPLLTEGLSSSPCQPLHRAAWVLSWHGSWQNKWSKTESKEKPHVFYEVASEVICFYHLLLVI